MWMGKFFRVFILILTVAFIVSCGGGGGDNSSTEQNLYRSYTIGIQRDVNAYAIEASIGDKELIVPNSKRKISFELPTSASVQYFLVRDKYANIVLLYPLFPEDDSNEIYVSVSSTADALISLIPQVQVLKDPEAIKRVIASVRSTPEYKQLIDSIEAYLKIESYNKDFFKNEAIIATLDQITKEVLPKLIGTSQGTSVSDRSATNRTLNDMLFEVYSDTKYVHVRNPYFVSYGFFPKKEPDFWSLPPEFVKPTTSLVSVDLKFWPPKVEFKDGYTNIAETKISLNTLPNLSSNYPLYIGRNLWTWGYDIVNGYLMYLEYIAAVKVSPDAVEKVFKDPYFFRSFKDLLQKISGMSLDDVKQKAVYTYVAAKELSSLIDCLLEYYNKYEGDVPYDTYKYLKWLKDVLDSTVFYVEKFVFKALKVDKSTIKLADIEAFLTAELGKSLDEIYDLSQEDLIELLKNFYSRKFAKNERFLKIWLVLRGFQGNDNIGYYSLISGAIDAYIVFYQAYNAFYEWAKEDAKVMDKILDIAINGIVADNVKEGLINWSLKAISKLNAFYAAGYTTNKIAPFIADLIYAPEMVKAYYYNGRVISTSPPLLENIRYLRGGVFSLEDTGGKIILNSPTDSFSITGTVKAEGSFEFIHKNSEAWWGSLPERDVFGFRILKKYIDAEGKKRSELVYEYSVSIYNPFFGTEKVKVSEYTKIVGVKTNEYSIDKYKEVVNGLVDTKHFTASISFSQNETPLGIVIQYWNADSAVVENRFIPIKINKDLSVEIIDYSECGKVRFSVEADAPLSEIQYEITYVDRSGIEKKVNGYLFSDNPSSDLETKISLTDYGFLLEYDRNKIDGDLTLTLKDNYGNSETTIIPVPEECFAIPVKPIITTFGISNFDECTTTGDCKFRVSVEGKITDWLIDFGDGNQATPASLSDLTDFFYSSHRYEQSGSYIVTLKVCNSELCDEKSIKVDVKVDSSTDKPIKIDFFKVEPNSGVAPLEVQFSWSILNLDNRVLTCYLDVNGDGADDYVIDNCGSVTTFEHTYTDTGNFTVKLTVAGDNGDMVTSTTVVEVRDVQESNDIENDGNVGNDSCNGLGITISKVDRINIGFTAYGYFFVNGKVYYITDSGIRVFDVENREMIENLSILNNGDNKYYPNHSIYVDSTENFFVLEGYYCQGDSTDYCERYIAFLERENSTLKILKTFKVEAQITRMYANKGYLYVLCRDGKVLVFDIRNFSAPTLLSEIKRTDGRYPLSITVINNIGYIGLSESNHESYLWILDLSDKTHPRNMSTLLLGGGNPSFIGQYKDQVLVITNGNYDNYLKFFDVSDPYNPKIVAKVPLAYGSTDGLLLSTNLLIVPNYYNAGLFLIDLENKKSTFYPIEEMEGFSSTKVYDFNDMLLITSGSNILFFKIENCQ